jgi:hypothetical protein
MTTKVIQFDLFKDLIKHGVVNPNNFHLPNDVIDKLQSLMSKGQVVTPFVFKQSEISWRAPTFVPTTALKNIVNELSENDKILKDIRIHLNKLTNDNYLKLVDKIRIEIEKFDVIPNEICKFILDIVLTNSANIRIYADLYSELSLNYPVLKEHIMEKIITFNDLFDEIKWIDSEKDFDGFCDMNKKNKNRRGLSDFISHLSNNNIIPRDLVLTKSREMIAKLYILIEEDNKFNEVDEIVENLVLLTKGIDRNIPDDYGKSINDYICEFAGFKSNCFKSLSRKSIYKFMDLNDEIKKLR